MTGWVQPEYTVTITTHFSSTSQSRSGSTVLTLNHDGAATIQASVAVSGDEVLTASSSDTLESLEGWSSPYDVARERTTGLLWSVLIHGHLGDSPEAASNLLKVTGEVMGPRRTISLRAADVANADNLDLHDAGIAAILQNKLGRAEKLFVTLHEQRPNARDVQVWLALVFAAQGEWTQARKSLNNACQKGSLGSRGLANQLFSIVCALECRPKSMIQHILVGQRLLGQKPLLMLAPPNAQADAVWFSDKIK